MAGKSNVLNDAKQVLIQLYDAINTLSTEEYTKKLTLLNHCSIGEIIRHIIEFFEQLQHGYSSSNICYDQRQRNISYENDIDIASLAIAIVIKNLNKKDKSLILNSIHLTENTSIQSTYFRELLYNIEHCIHHQAIIRIGFLELQKNNLPKEFGIAKSTLEYRKNVYNKLRKS